MAETNSDLYVRKATVNDAASITQVLHEAFAEYESLYTPAAFAATVCSIQKVQHRMSEGPLWVAIQNEHVVGTVSAIPDSSVVYIRGMALSPAARGQGIGRLLLQQVEQFAHEQSATRLFLSTTPFLTRAICLYEQFGFQRSDEGPSELFGTPLFTMVKTLEQKGS